MSTRTVAKAAGLIAAATVVSRLLGFLRESLLSGFFGKGYVMDAYNIGFLLPDLFYNLLVAGALSSAFIPVLSSFLAKDRRDEAWEVANSVINLVTLLLCVVIIPALIFAPELINLYIPQAPAQTKELATALTRILLLQPLLLSAAGFSMGILNSVKVFGPSALGSVVYSAGVIAVGVLLQPFFPNGQAIKAFALGVVLGSLGNFVVQIPGLKRAGFRYRLVMNLRHPGVRKLALLAFPIILSFSLNQIIVFVYQNLNSTLPPGSLAAFMYAYRLQQLPVGIFAASIGVAVFPTLTDFIARNEREQFRQSFSSAFRSILFVSVPISVGMIVLAEPLIKVIYQHGLFTYADTQAVVPPLIFFALGVVPQSAIVFLPRTFYALQDTWTPVLVGVVSLIVNVVLMNLFIVPLAQGGLALAMAISALVNMFLLLYLLRRRIGPMDGWKILLSFAKIAAASLIMGLVIFMVSKAAAELVPPTKLGEIVTLGLGTAAGGVVFLLAAWLLRMPELNFVLHLLRRKTAK